MILVITATVYTYTYTTSSASGYTALGSGFGSAQSTDNADLVKFGRKGHGRFSQWVQIVGRMGNVHR
jgi:hypothetical protein